MTVDHDDPTTPSAAPAAEGEPSAPAPETAELAARPEAQPGEAAAERAGGTPDAPPASPAETPARAGARAGGLSEAELQAMQAAEEAKAGDPELEEVESAAIDAPGSDEEKEEPFEKLAAAAKRLSADRVRTILETLLFLAERPLSSEELRQATGIDVERVEKALDKLSGHYREGVCGIVLHEVAGGWQLRSSPDNAAFARRWLKVKPQRLTRAALETLAIIAYRQPVTRPEIEEIRGVDCGAVVKALLERKLIKILGKKEEPGRPMLYGTTREFLEFFALKDLASLPTLREFHELSEEHREIVEKQPEPQDGGISGIVADLSDEKLRAELEAKRAESDAALEELERAIEAADEKSQAVQATLEEKQKKEEDEGPEAER
ncbi:MULTISPECIES: SMC-Scp complex subunit ScpB [Anaeromyxobacter]|uniref:SMC-Scp complex subunit ScpB n=1 Tax=Anaeromyxobacter TaxID=161492 RepID=UPI001F5A7134|nr:MULTISPECIES: SMC-Scp complex subunit ScpB [unclassified Anaeromyxobacter]